MQQFNHCYFARLSSSSSIAPRIVRIDRPNAQLLKKALDAFQIGLGYGHLIQTETQFVRQITGKFPANNPWEIELACVEALEKLT